jgi:hypothetical protein
MAVVFDGFGIPQGDVIECRVHLGCTKEVSSFNLLLQNWNGKYSSGGSVPLSVGVDGSISIGRDVNTPQIITCRVESLRYESSSTESYVRVSGRCWGERLFRRVVTKTYENMKGEAIVRDLLDNYVGLSHVRDATELVEDTDTTYARLEYKDTPVFEIIKYVADSADKNGVIGFDFRVAPDGKFEFFPRNSKTSPVSLSELIEEYEFRKDIHDVRNKITVYGARKRVFPLDLDADWMESTSGWTLVEGTSLSVDSTRKRKGNCSVKVSVGSGVYNTRIRRTWSSAIRDYERFCAWIYPGAGMNTAQVRLLAPDTNNYFYADMNLDRLDWQYREWFLGSRHEYNVDNNPNGVWRRNGSPNWFNIMGLELLVYFNYDNTSVWYDGDLGFLNGPFQAVAEDSNSQNAYGLRELVEVDEELYSDNECSLRANALLDYYKNPAEYLTVKSTVIDYGNTPLLPGDKIYVSLPNENVSGYFRILSVEYFVDARTQTLEVTLELGREKPLLADYLYALQSKTSHLSRHKTSRLV